MRTLRTLAAVTILASLASAGQAKDARSILETARKKQLERWQGVEAYVLDQAIAGHSSRSWFQRIEGADDAGLPQTRFVPISAASMPGRCTAGGPDPWALTSDLMAGARLVGTEDVDGRSAFHLLASNVDLTEEADGKEYVIQSVHLWIDRSEYVPLRMKIDGVLASNGERRPMTIESTQSDYRRVPGSAMYEPYRRRMSITRVLDAQQQVELRDVQQELAALEGEMATMTADQRAMVEQLLAPRRQALESLAAGEGFVTEILVRSIEVNPELPATLGEPCPDNGFEVLAPSPPTGVSPARATSATGASPQLASVRRAAVNGAAAAPSSTPGAPSIDPQRLEQARQACLEEKAAAAQKARKAQKKKRGLGRLARGLGRVADRLGVDVGREIAEVSRDVYAADATADDLAAAAEDLGLTPEDLEDCRNPL